MRAEALTQALGGRWHGRYGSARCPAHEDKRPSLSIKDGDDGRLLLHCHVGCEFPAVMAALRDRGLTENLERDAQRDAGHRSRRLDQSLSDLLTLIWSKSQAISGSPAERYLRARAIDGSLPANLRYHRRLRHPGGTYLPAMIAQVEHVQAGVVGLHRTYLDEILPRKTSLTPDKAMLGPCKGGAVRLRSGQQGLAVCEGIETTLSLASGLEPGFAVWAALSTSGVAGLELPPRDEFGGALLIGADGDPPGRRAAHDLADRATALGWTVDIVMAPDGQDFNDLVREPDHG